MWSPAGARRSHRPPPAGAGRCRRRAQPLGQRTALVTQIGADDYGALIRTHLERTRRDDPRATRGPADQPGVLATLDAGGAASYEFDLSWDVRGLRLAEDSTAMHIGSLGVMLTPGGEQVLRLAESACRRGDVVTSYDPNARPSVTPDRRAVAATVERAAASAHIVKMSDEDLAFLFPAARRPPGSPSGCSTATGPPSFWSSRMGSTGPWR